jgi:YD repeat-containing protein
MTSETRTFTGLTGSYSLNYSSYNLANELTSLSLPTWSQTVGYNYDSAGRLNAVTASGFSTWTYNWQTGQTTYTPLANFATNLGYRAWGGIKHIDYGNGALLNQQYNQRLQPSNADYTQAGITEPTSYDYYADGRIHHAYDSTPNVFDRAYEYDQVGRLKQAYSGAQARGGATNDGPYLQSYGYDTFGNLTNRTNYFWAHLMPGDAATYTNNRRADYGYDAAGNVLGDTGEHSYDAADRQTDSSTTYVSALTTVYLTQTYDGDGRPAKQTEHRVIEQESGPPEEEWTTSYFLRSSVLNGAPIVDLSGYGMKDKLRVYAVGTILAEEGNLIVHGVQWRYPKPGTGSWIGSNGGQEMDPLGADVTTNPYLYYQSPSYLNLKENGERLFDEGDDPFSPGSGCSLDGMPVSCSYLNRRLDDGSVQTQYVGLYERDRNLPAGAPNRFEPVTRDIRNHGLGIYEVWMPPEFRNEYSRGGWVLVPQSTYDPRVDFRDYAEQLSNDGSITDCLKLALMAYKAGQVFGGANPFADSGKGIIRGLMSGLTEYSAVNLGQLEESNRNFRVGVFRGGPQHGDPHFGGGFMDSGFAPAFQDHSNQVRHFTFYLGAGWGIGNFFATRGLYESEGTDNPNDPDVALGRLAISLGSHFNGNYKQLAQDIWHNVCGQTSSLNLP